jgi:probable HAF family extracellular repeat protein
MKSRFSARIAKIAICFVLAIAPTLPAQDNQGHDKSFRYSLKILDTLGGTFGEAWGVNNRGLVTGPSNLPGDVERHAFLWSQGLINDLGSL